MLRSDNQPSNQPPLATESKRPLLASAVVFTQATVAALPTWRIAAMARSELVAVIESVRDGHLRPGVRERLPEMDADTLRRLVFLTRRLCRCREETAVSLPR